MFLGLIELLILAFSSVRLLMLALILMHMNTKAGILIRFVLGMLLKWRNKTLHKVEIIAVTLSLAHKQRNKLWRVQLMCRTPQIRKTHIHHSHRIQHHHKVTLMIYPSSVELIKRAFNAYVVQFEKCV
nr:MAG TPA: hypothetical protein [Bacteriophage sp.]